MTMQYKSSVILVLLIAIGACFAADYAEIPANKYSQYPLIPTLRTTGINAILNQALASGKIQNTQFSLSATNHVYLKVNGTYSYYKFDVSLKNAKGDQINAVFEIRYNTKTKASLVTSQSYSIKYASTPVPSQPTPAYVNVPSSQYASTLIQDLAKYGKDYIATQAINSNKLPAGQYLLTLIQSVKKQVLATGVTNYKFEIVFEKSDGTREVEATFEVSYTVSSGKKAMKSYGYQVLPFSV